MATNRWLKSLRTYGQDINNGPFPKLLTCTSNNQRLGRCVLSFFFFFFFVDGFVLTRGTARKGPNSDEELRTAKGTWSEIREFRAFITMPTVTAAQCRGLPCEIEAKCASHNKMAPKP